MRLLGWRFAGDVPNVAKAVIIVAPHTSNWDFFIALAARLALGLRASFLGKYSLFRGPVGAFMRLIGGVPVDRSSPHHVVDQTVAAIRSADAMLLALSPEGTRKKLPKWRTGFFHVAHGAGVPIVPVALDYSTRTVRFFPAEDPGESPDEALTRFGARFSASMARYPEQY